MILPLVIYLLEVMSIKRRVSVKESVRSYNEAAWRTIWLMIQGDGALLEVTNLGARVVTVVLSFVSLIISSSYTANLAAFLTLKSLGDINTVSDLVGLSASTIELYGLQMFTFTFTYAGHPDPLTCSQAHSQAHSQARALLVRQVPG